jgi:hypothetical protein
LLVDYADHTRRTKAVWAAIKTRAPRSVARAMIQSGQRHVSDHPCA